VGGGSPTGDLPGDVPVGLSTGGTGVIGHDGLAIAGRLRHSDGAGDRDSERLAGEVTADLVRHLSGEAGASVVHREDDGSEDEIRVEIDRDAVDRSHKLADSFKGVVLGLDGQEKLGGGDQGVEREESEGGWAVEDDIVGGRGGEVPVEGVGEAALATDHADELEFGRGEVDGGREDV